MGNPMTNNLPPSIDMMLQDMAQMTNEFTYLDIYNFCKNGVSEEQLKALRNLYRRWRRYAEYNDEEKMKEVAIQTKQLLVSVGGVV